MKNLKKTVSVLMCLLLVIVNVFSLNGAVFADENALENQGDEIAEEAAPDGVSEVSRAREGNPLEEEAETPDEEGLEAPEEEGAEEAIQEEPSDDEEEPSDNEEEHQTEYSAGELNASGKGFEINLSYGEEAEIPEGAELSVKEISAKASEYDEYVEQAATKVFEGKDTEADSLPYARFFDITILSPDGEVIEPKNTVSVVIDLKDNALDTQDVDFSVVHFEENNDSTKAEIIPIQTDEAVSFDADSFSIYGVVFYYTVDFYYGDAEYHMNGGSEMMMSDLFGKLGIEKSAADIKSVEFTDESLVKFTKEGSDWRINSLEPFTTSETLTITFNDGEVIEIQVEDAYVNSWGMGNGNVLAELNDEPGGGKYKLIIRANTAGGGRGGEGVIQNKTIDNAASWGYNSYRDRIVEVEIAAKITVKSGQSLKDLFSGMTNLEKITFSKSTSPNPGSFDITGAANIANMFQNCRKLDLAKGDTKEFIENLNTSNVGDFASTFNGAFTDTSLTDKKLDLSKWTNNEKAYNLQNMFANSGIEEVILNNENFKTRPYANGGCQMGAMFFNAKTKKIDMSNITLTGRPADTTAKTGHNAQQEAGGILSTSRNGNATLETVIMNNTKFVDMAAFNGMFSNCPKLTTVQMTSDTPGDMAPDAVDMSEMFANSFTSPSGTGTPTIDVSGFGKLENIVNMDGFVNGCTNLQVLNIDNLDNSRIEASRGKHDADGDPDNDPGAAALGVDWGRMLDLHTCTALKTISAKDSKVWMTFNEKDTPSKELFLAENDAAIYKFTDKQFEFASDVEPTIQVETKRDYVDLLTDRHETGTRGSDNHAESSTNKNMTGGSHLNTNGAGFLAPGVYTIGDADRTNPSLDAPITYYRITEMGKGLTTRTVEINEDLGGILVKSGDAIVTDERSIADFWEKDLVDGDKVLEKYDNGEYKTLATITYRLAATDINGDYHDVIVEIKRITFKDVELIPNAADYDRREHDSNWVATDEYYRTVLEAQSDKIKLNNYVRSTSATNGSSTSSEDRKVLSQGSGTYIDFDIRIRDAVDGASVLFYIDDLDVPHAQDWILDDDDACYDKLPWENVTYGNGSEGMILGTGNDIDTLSFADHTGLQLLNRNYVVSTGSDPSTNWSEFYVRANAKRSSYTWTSGIGCDTDLLKNTEAVPPPKPVWVFPEAIKYVNRTKPGGDYADEYFDFEFSPADVEGTNYEYNGVQREVTSLSNEASETQDLKNKKEYITINELEFPVPPNNVPAKYIYKIIEKPGTDLEIIDYDTDTEHYMQVVVFRPTNDIEMYQGTRAEIVIGTKTKNSSTINWDTDDVYVVYATNAQLVDGKSGPDGEAVYKDAQNIEFYRVDDKYYRLSDDQEMDPTSHAKVDRKVTYNSQEYQVKIDKHGVEYFKSSDGKYRDPKSFEEVLVAREGDIDPETVDNDSPLVKEVKVNDQTLHEDIHGVKYYGSYYDETGSKLTVKDGEFNPNENDKIVYENAESSTGETIYVHENGQKYFVKNGKYYDADDESKELVIKTSGDIDPLPTDSNAKSNETQTKDLKERFSGKGYPVKLEPTHNVEYYQDNEGNYFTRYGTQLQVNEATFTPSDTDGVIKMSREIWEDGSGVRFYKNEGNYYKADDDTLMTKLSEGTLDTSEVIDMGSFNNTTNVSDITISKTTEDGKAGKFKVHVKFDNGFEPKHVVYEPASAATFSKVEGTNDTWEFTIEEGQRLTIKEVPFRTVYTITEPVDANGWELIDIVDKDDVSSNTGKITTKTPDGEPFNPDYAHTIKNRLTEIIVDKYERASTTGKQDFTFTVEITGLTAEKEYSYGWLNETEQEFFTGTANDEGKIADAFTFTLKDEEDIALVVPKGSNVKVTETAVTDYVTEVKKDDGDKVKANNITVNNVVDDPRTTLHFINTKIDPIELEIPVQKILQGRSWKDSDEFAAGLVLVSTEAPMPENTQTIGVGEKVSEVVINNKPPAVAVKNGNKVIGYKTKFDPITYTIDDVDETYQYHVRELTAVESSVDAIPGVTYDEEKFDVEVKITLDETNPKNPKLVATATYTNDEGDEVDLSGFTNVYDAEETSYKMEAVKDYFDVTEGKEIKLTGNEFLFAVRPIGDNKEIAPMPEGTEGDGADRVFYKGNEDDGDIEFEQNPDGIKDGMVFNYKALLEAGVDDAALHSDEGVDFEYVLYEIIPGTPEGIAKGKTLASDETLVNNEDGTYSVIGDDQETVYDGVHHTRKITVKVIQGDATETGEKHEYDSVEYDVYKDFDEVKFYERGDKAYKVEDDSEFVPNLETLDVESHADDHKGCYYISEKGDTPEEIPMSDVEGYDPERHHFKLDEHGDEILGAPIFINYRFDQKYVDLKVKKIWDDADDQDRIRPNSITLNITSDEGDYATDLVVKGSSWTASEKLPVYEFDIKTEKTKEITYTVKEKVPAGYEVSYEPATVDAIQLDPTASEFVLTVTNKHTPGQGAIEGDETWGGKGEEQTGKPNYKVNPKNPVTPTNLVKPDKEGATISDDGKVVTIPGEGTYTLQDDGTIKFKPDPEFVGDPTPVDVEGRDKQENLVSATYTPHVVDNHQEVTKVRKVTYVYDDGSPVLDEIGQPLVDEFTAQFYRTGVVDPKTGKITKWHDWTPMDIPEVVSPEIEGYTPDKDVVPEVKNATPDKWPKDEVVVYSKKADEAPTWLEGTPYKTKDKIRRVQTGTLTFKPGGSPIISAKLIDPNTGEITDKLEIDVYKDGRKIGTYKLNPNGKTNPDGSVAYEITFTPYEDYVGTPPPITLRVFDEDGNHADGIYQPEVVGSDKSSPSGAKTGDSNNIILWVVLLALALGLMIAMLIRRKASHKK